MIYGFEPESDDIDDEDPCEREELDFARGICRECDTWGDECRADGGRPVWVGGYYRGCAEAR